MPVPSLRSRTNLKKPKLFYVEGVRHSAVVLARDAAESIRLATAVSTESKTDPRVLYGYVGDRESPIAHELTLPSGYQLVRKGNSAG